MVAPRVSAESSITTKPCLSAISLITGQLQRLPIKFGANIATVLSVICASIWLTSIQYVNGSTSTNTGINSFFTKHPMDVENVSTGVITSPPAGKLKASTPINRAEEPEFT